MHAHADKWKPKNYRTSNLYLLLVISILMDEALTSIPQKIIQHNVQHMI